MLAKILIFVINSWTKWINRNIGTTWTYSCNDKVKAYCNYQATKDKYGKMVAMNKDSTKPLIAITKQTNGNCPINNQSVQLEQLINIAIEIKIDCNSSTLIKLDNPSIGI